MGRDSGFIAAYATLANSDVNFCLIPEEPLILDGENGFLRALERRLDRKHHAVIVVAEGVGRTLTEKSAPTKDASGNVVRDDIGLLLKQKIAEHFRNVNKPLSLKYIDPGYMIRSLPADSNDSAFCLMLGQNAVHAGMSGRTNMVVGFWNQYFVDVPIALTIGERKKIDPNGHLWQTVLQTTGQARTLPS
jgi:6-phosphofructokinase 1